MNVRVDRRAKPGIFILGALALLVLAISKSWWAFSFCLFLLGAHIAFFRDPRIQIPPGDGPVSAAYGKVVEISSVFEERYLQEEAVKIGIFLSIFVPHVNRIPIDGVIRYQHYEMGKFLNALDENSVNLNESNWIGVEEHEKRVLVRQIAGAIARRIHFDVRPGQKVKRGEKMGIICYGSRVECFFPKRYFRPIIEIGSHVKAGQTVLGEWIL